MDEAIVVFSRKGIFQTTIAARDVRSREHARKLWPLVSPGASRQMVTWVSPSFESGKLRRRSHFRVLPARRPSVCSVYRLARLGDGFNPRLGCVSLPAAIAAIWSDVIGRGGQGLIPAERLRRLLAMPPGMGPFFRPPSYGPVARVLPRRRLSKSHQESS